MNEQEQIADIELLSHFAEHYCGAKEKEAISNFITRLAQYKGVSEQQAAVAFASSFRYAIAVCALEDVSIYEVLRYLWTVNFPDIN